MSCPFRWLCSSRWGGGGGKGKWSRSGSRRGCLGVVGGRGGLGWEPGTALPDPCPGEGAPNMPGISECSQIFAARLSKCQCITWDSTLRILPDAFRPQIIAPSQLKRFWNNISTLPYRHILNYDIYIFIKKINPLIFNLLCEDFFIYSKYFLPIIISRQPSICTERVIQERNRAGESIREEATLFL